MNSMGSDELTPSLQNGRNQINEWNDTIITQNQVIYSLYPYTHPPKVILFYHPTRGRQFIRIFQ